MKQLPITLSLMLASVTVTAQDYTSFPADTATAITPQRETNTVEPIREREDGSWIGIKGTVAMVGGNSFFLNYGDSTVVVGLTGEALRKHDFAKGQQLTVYGRVDKDLFEKNIIKARAVVIEGNDDNELTVIGEEDKVKLITASPVSGSVVHGVVSAVTATRVVIDQGKDKISIDTSELSTDTNTGQGGVQVKQGDLVSVQGIIRRDFWDKRTMKATSLDVIPLEGWNEQRAGSDRDDQ